MIRFSKIPASIRKKGATTCGPYAVFIGWTRVGKFLDILSAADNKSGIPAHGYIKTATEKVYYCRVGFLKDDDICNPKL